MNQYDTRTKKLNDILYRAQSATFPCAILSEVNTAISFFSAHFHGLNDIVHLYQNNVKNIWINDLNEKLLRETAELYDLQDYMLPGDAFEVARLCAEAEMSFDLVVCDPFTGLMKEVIEDQSFYNICSRYLVFGVTKSLILEKGNGDLDRMFRKLSDQFTVQSAVKRSDFKGGVYWVLLSKNS